MKLAGPSELIFATRVEAARYSRNFLLAALVAFYPLLPDNKALNDDTDLLQSN